MHSDVDSFIQYVFTSFLSRDNAFAEIHDAWWRFRHVGSVSDDGYILA